MPVIIVDKPGGLTSFAVVGMMRGLLTEAGRLTGGAALSKLRVGHGGTLDPMASGVLPLLIGEGTKLADFFLDADKVYDAEVRFGSETDTLDAEGAVTAQHPVGPLDATTINLALERFRGPIQQVPPLYSALKKDGRPMYAYARAGETVERHPRPVTIFELALIEIRPPDRISLRVRCSKGTYIRSLAADLGAALGGGAHLSALRRVASGPFHIEAAHTVVELRAAAAPASAAGERPAPRAIRIMSLPQALAGQPVIAVDDGTARRLSMGQPVIFEDLGPGAEGIVPGARVGVIGPDGELLAMVARDGRVDAQGRGVARILRGFSSEAPVRAALTALFSGGQGAGG